MKISVIGANGRSGQIFVAAALAAGHTVTAGMRGESHLAPHKLLSIQKCDATNEVHLRQLITGQDAVVSLIGHVKGSPASVQTEAIQKLLSAMSELTLKRLVSVTGTGVRFPGDNITLMDRFLNFGVSLIDPSRVNDGIQFVELLKKSEADWTVIRVLKLTECSAHPFQLTEHGPAKSFVARQEVATAILGVLEKSSFLKQAPIISNA